MVATLSPASTDTYTRTAGTNRIATIATAAGTRTLSHDARGNLSGEARPGSINVTTAYDGYGRLTGYTRESSLASPGAGAGAVEPSLTMLYSGNDERVALTRGDTSTRIIHDHDGRIIGEYTASPTTPIAEYIWFLPKTSDAGETGRDDGLGGWHPLAVVSANGAGGPASLLWLHSNHLGTPVRASNASGANVPITGFTLLGFPGPSSTLLSQ